MKSFLPLLAISFLVFGIYSCEKTGTDTSGLCNNGLLDGEETEIDCGGDCDTCAVATFKCTLGNTAFNGTDPKGYILGPSIRVASVDDQGRPMHFMFLPVALNTPLPISGGAFSYNGEPYSKGPDDTGHVTITMLDTTRKLISGTFGFSGNRVTNNTVNVVKDGTFTDIRYGDDE